MRCFLFYVDDWLSSKSIAMMDAPEERGFLRLLLHEWTEDDCCLPDEDAQLAVLSMLGRQWFKPTADKEKRIGSMTSGQKLRREFVPHDGRIFNARLYREWEYQRKVNEARRENGHKGGRPKKANHNHPVISEEPYGLANEKLSETNIVSVSSLGFSEKGKGSGENHLKERYRELIAAWPNPTDVELGCQVWISLVDIGTITESSISEVFEGLERWKKSEQWTSGKQHSIPTWLGWSKDGRPSAPRWNDHPRPAKRLADDGEVHY